MKVRNLGRRLNETFLPLITTSVLFELLVIGEYISFGMAFAVVNAAAFLCYIVWNVTCLRKSLIDGMHRKTYYLTNGIAILSVAAISLVMAIINLDPYYYFLFSPLAFLKIAGFTNLVTSTLVSLFVMIVVYLIVPKTVKRRRHHRHHHDSGPVDTTNFIMRS